jgi:hypothetical protein
MKLKFLSATLAAAAVALCLQSAMAQPYPPPPPPPPGAPMAPQPPALEPCRVDVQRYCQGIRPGAGRIRACMRSNQDRLSPACKAAITGVIERRRQMRDERRKMWGYPPRPPRPPMAPGAVPPPPPPPPVTMQPVPN